VVQSLDLTQATAVADAIADDIVTLAKSGPPSQKSASPAHAAPGTPRSSRPALGGMAPPAAAHATADDTAAVIHELDQLFARALGSPPSAPSLAALPRPASLGAPRVAGIADVDRILLSDPSAFLSSPATAVAAAASAAAHAPLARAAPPAPASAAAASSTRRLAAPPPLLPTADEAAALLRTWTRTPATKRN
jgi:hypothetical protein